MMRQRLAVLLLPASIFAADVFGPGFCAARAGRRGPRRRPGHGGGGFYGGRYGGYGRGYYGRAGWYGVGVGLGCGWGYGYGYPYGYPYYPYGYGYPVYVDPIGGPPPGPYPPGVPVAGQGPRAFPPGWRASSAHRDGRAPEHPRSSRRGRPHQWGQDDAERPPSRVPVLRVVAGCSYTFDVMPMDDTQRQSGAVCPSHPGPGRRAGHHRFPDAGPAESGSAEDERRSKRKPCRSQAEGQD